MRFLNICLILFLYLCQVLCDDNNIVACGGFIKSDIKGFIYKNLSAHLTFVDETINYVTDILPNGAYSVPIYDFGIYVIKIVGPKGWYIEPINGYQMVINNQETCNEDFNFKFVGYSIYGKISTANIDHGPGGIFIDLVNNSVVIAQTATVNGGDFTISRVMPGNYSLNFKSETVDGKSLELNDTIYNLEVKDDNVLIKDSFIIYGYPVFGDIKFNNEPVENVEIYLFSKSIDINNFNFSKYKCLKFDKPMIVEGYFGLCKVISNVKGEFVFPLLPGGKYLLIPTYQTDTSNYDIFPRNYEFQITSSSVDLRSRFQIIGFSVTGTVASLNGSPISNAKIYVDDKLLSKTNLEGNYSLKGVTVGKHEILIKLDGYVFNKTEVIFNPKNPVIKPIHPEKISICGSIHIGNTKGISDLLIKRKIILINESNGDVVDSVYTNGVENLDTVDKNNVISKFCFYAKPGSYIVKPVIDPSINVMSLAPNQIKVLLTSIPLTIKFSPFRGSISGIVRCIERCNTGEFEVTLKSRNENIELTQLTQHISISKDLSNQGYFQFKDIIPGEYQIELISANNQLPLDKNRWCWSKTVLVVDVIDKNIDGLIFEQIGFSVPIFTSHDIEMNYYHLTKPNILMGSKSLSKGISQVCLPKPGKYQIKINTCHKLKNSSYLIDLNELCGKLFDFRDPKCHIKIDVLEFNVKVNFELLQNEKIINSEDLKANVKGVLSFDSNSDKFIKDIKWDKNQGHLDLWVKPNIEVHVSVESTKYLVKPDHIRFTIPDDNIDCLTERGIFQLEAGIFINGSVWPSIKSINVEIRKQVSSLDEDDIEPIVASSETNEDGQFSVGPLNSSFDYEIKLFKEGYKIVQNMDTANQYQFSAYKLSELIVEVVDNFTGKPLSGILLSIIGDDLRRNELTNENGIFSFVGLTPGVYYLRAMMKELEFIPHGAVEVIIIEGSIEKISIKAARTSFSLHGKVISLNGESEAGVIIEAHPMNKSIDLEYKLKCKTNLFRNEHATTDETGTFRIRGLQPKCEYNLSLKIVNSNEENGIIRSYPDNIVIAMNDKDIHNIKIYALRNVVIREISAMVWTDDNIYQSSLSLLVYSRANPENILAVHKFISEGMYFQMNLPYLHNRVEYVVRLQSNLNPSLYANISAQEQTLDIEEDSVKSVYKHFNFHFHPIKKSIADSDITMTLSSSFMLPLLIIIFSSIFFKRDSLESSIVKLIGLFKFFSGYIFKQPNMNVQSGSVMKSSLLDATELSELNNAIAKPKSTVVVQPAKKIPFWSRPKKV